MEHLLVGATVDDFAHAELVGELPFELNAGTVFDCGFQARHLSSSDLQPVHRPGYAELAISFNAEPRARY